MAGVRSGAIIGRNVRRLRDGGLWTREELAEKAGVSRQTIAHLELGTSGRPRRGTIEKLADALDVPIETLLAGTDGAAEITDATEPLPQKRAEHPLVIVGRVESDGLRMVVLWNVPPDEREPYRASLRMNGVVDFREEEMDPQAAEQAAVLIAGAV